MKKPIAMNGVRAPWESERPAFVIGSMELEQANEQLRRRCASLERTIDCLRANGKAEKRLRSRGSFEDARTIQIAVARRFDITREAIIGRGRPERFVWPRHLAMTLVHELLRMPIGDVSRLFARTHATVHWALRNVADRVAVYPTARAEYGALKKDLAALLTCPDYQI